jgi:chromosome segregation ATPase
MHVLEEEKGLLIAEMAEKLAQGTHAKEAVDALSERVSAQALALRTRQEELTARTTELLEANDKLSAMQATEERASEAENRLLVALAAINAKDVTMRHAEAQIKELQGQLELKQQETARGGEQRTALDERLVDVNSLRVCIKPIDNRHC